MKTEEMEAFDQVRDEVVRKAVAMADRILLEACCGNTEVLMLLTCDVARSFSEKTLLMLRTEVWRKEMLCEIPPEVLNKGH
jgi:hypothetical protein